MFNFQPVCLFPPNFVCMYVIYFLSFSCFLRTANAIHLASLALPWWKIGGGLLISWAWIGYDSNCSRPNYHLKWKNLPSFTKKFLVLFSEWAFDQNFRWRAESFFIPEDQQPKLALPPPSLLSRVLEFLRRKGGGGKLWEISFSVSKEAGARGRASYSSENTGRGISRKFFPPFPFASYTAENFKRAGA